MSASAHFRPFGGGRWRVQFTSDSDVLRHRSELTLSATSRRSGYPIIFPSGIGAKGLGFESRLINFESRRPFHQTTLGPQVVDAIVLEWP
jgi:hypothetical protein